MIVTFILWNFYSVGFKYRLVMTCIFKEMRAVSAKRPPVGAICCIAYHDFFLFLRQGFPAFKCGTSEGPGM